MVSTVVLPLRSREGSSSTSEGTQHSSSHTLSLGLGELPGLFSGYTDKPSMRVRERPGSNQRTIGMETQTIFKP